MKNNKVGAVKGAGLEVAVVFTKNESELLELFIDSKKSLDLAGEKFRKAVAFAHQHKIAEDRIALVLGAAGFPPPRISEFKKIAGADPETYKRFQTGELHWRPALERARDEAAEKKGKGLERKKNKRSRAAVKLTSAFEHYVNAADSFKAFTRTLRGNIMIVVPPGFNGEVATVGGLTVTVTTGTIK